LNKVIAALIAALPFLSAAMALPPSQSQSISARSANGQRLFVQHCASCHDTRGTALRSGPGLKSYYRTHQPHPSDSALRSIIQQGKGKMPAFRTLNNSQTDDLIAFLKTL
jgi:mono/diheme cytochrome c family protein